MSKTFVVAAVLVFSAAAHADDGRVALIEEMLELTRMEEMTRVSQREGFKMGLSLAPTPIPEACEDVGSDHYPIVVDCALGAPDPQGVPVPSRGGGAAYGGRPREASGVEVPDRRPDGR